MAWIGASLSTGFCKNHLTVADLTLGSSLMYAQQTEVPLAEFPNIQAWHARITALDGWKKTAS